MKRKLTKEIERVDKDKNKHLIAVCGMKGTGKTYSVLEYVKSHYDEYLYIDAAHDKGFSEYFKNRQDIVQDDFFEEYFKINSEYLVSIPIILDEPDDEITEKLFTPENLINKKIILIISDAVSAGRLKYRFMGDISIIRVYPMNFGEFLVSMDKEWYDEVINGHLLSRKKIPEMIHSELQDLFDVYTQTGGMPEVVAEYRKTGTLENIRERQDFLRSALWYLLCNNTADESGTKVSGMLNAVEKNLEKPNHKFMYSMIRDGVSRKMYEEVTDMLCSKGVVLKVPKVSISDKSQKSWNTDDNIDTQDTDLTCISKDDFRLYYGDISLYSRPDPAKVLESILIQNVTSCGIKTYYWESGKGASLGMVLDTKSGLVPVDIRMFGRGNGRSVNSFLNENRTEYSIRISNENCRFEDNQTILPIYAAYGLNTILV